MDNNIIESNNTNTQSETEPIAVHDSVPESNINESIQGIVELTIEDIFVNLILISRIEVGNKLIQSDKHINIDTSFFKSLTRWYNGSNRNNTLNFINIILIKTFAINAKLLKDNTDESNQLLLRLTTNLKNSLNGLINLKQTYSNDKLFQSEIDVLIDNINCKLDFNSKNLNFNKMKVFNTLINENDNLLSIPIQSSIPIIENDNSSQSLPSYLNHKIKSKKY